MADFVAVLKKTLDELRRADARRCATRIYDKARSTHRPEACANFRRRCLPTLSPSRNAALEDAISSVERDYARAAPASDPLAELEHIFSSIDRNKNQSEPCGNRAGRTDPAGAAAAKPEPTPPAASRQD